jgi:hypothetical protein
MNVDEDLTPDPSAKPNEPSPMSEVQILAPRPEKRNKLMAVIRHNVLPFCQAMKEI